MVFCPLRKISVKEFQKNQGFRGSGSQADPRIRGKTFKKQIWLRGTWVAQSVKRPTLGFSSGHDLTVHEIEPRLGLCAGSADPAWDSLSLSVSLCPFPACALSLSR